MTDVGGMSVSLYGIEGNGIGDIDKGLFFSLNICLFQISSNFRVMEERKNVVRRVVERTQLMFNGKNFVEALACVLCNK
ncbi:uncharacterized protein LOC116119063 isoform X2 [Pistacia vera]|uniref:uncharacterized protein LOC116119063 isoform X2 n=1 Tax=Pistacia vera TaxID=55513 RepID=UPI001263505E|nr:uncharacterized protein LOC116119063 isoform X2 [Pistacia vera]